MRAEFGTVIGEIVFYKNVFICKSCVLTLSFANITYCLLVTNCIHVFIFFLISRSLFLVVCLHILFHGSWILFFTWACRSAVCIRMIKIVRFIVSFYAFVGWHQKNYFKVPLNLKRPIIFIVFLSYHNSSWKYKGKVIKQFIDF